MSKTTILFLLIRLKSFMSNLFLCIQKKARQNVGLKFNMIIEEVSSVIYHQVPHNGLIVIVKFLVSQPSFTIT